MTGAAAVPSTATPPQNEKAAEQTFSIVIRGGKVALPQGVVHADIGIQGETIAAIAEDLGQGALEIDASDRLVAPGGIDPIRRECLDHIIIFNEHHLRGVLSRYFQYHHKTRTHLSLIKDCPEPRRIQPPSAGKIIAFPEVGGLHHRYERRAA